MPQYPFQLVDVFGETPFSGNPLAVVALDDDRDTAELQAITRWLNLSETAFLLPPTTPDADYRVRIFTLDRELPFAGHPTLGSCHAWLALRGVPHEAEKVVQECGAGLVTVRRGAEGLAFAAPPLIRSGAVEPEKVIEACTVLGIARLTLSPPAGSTMALAGLASNCVMPPLSSRSNPLVRIPRGSISASSACTRQAILSPMRCARSSVIPMGP